jgi:protein TonB
VKVETDIDANGAVTACRVAVSSGFGSLDKAALDAVQQARFLPAMKNGKRVALKIVIPIRFQLTRN